MVREVSFLYVEATDENLSDLAKAQLVAWPAISSVNAIDAISQARFLSHTFISSTAERNSLQYERTSYAITSAFNDWTLSIDTHFTSLCKIFCLFSIIFSKNLNQCYYPKNRIYSYFLFCSLCGHTYFAINNMNYFLRYKFLAGIHNMEHLISLIQMSFSSTP